MSSSPVEEDEYDMDEEEEMDMFQALGSLLCTEEGETIATLLSGLKDSVDKIAMGLDMHNKIMIKILAEMKKPAAA